MAVLGKSWHTYGVNTLPEAPGPAPAARLPVHAPTPATAAMPAPLHAPGPLLGAPLTGQTGGGGGRGRRRRRGRGGGARGTPDPTPAPTPSPGPVGTPWPSFSAPWLGRIPMWPFQGQGGPSSSAPAGGHARRCCSPVRAVLDPARSTQPVADLA